MNRNLRQSLFKSYGVAVLALVLATLLRLVLDPALNDRFPFVTYMAAILFVAWRCGLGPALLCLGLGVFLADLLFIPPRGRPSFDNPEFYLGGTLYFAVGLSVALLADALERARLRAVAEAEQLAQKHERLGLEIAERRQAEAQLAHEQKRQRVTLQSIGDAVIATDIQARITLFNSAAEALTGWSEREALGKSLGEVLPLTDERTGEALECPVQHATRHEGAPAPKVALLHSRLGDRVPIETAAASIRDDSDQIVGAVLTFRDITERRWAERKAQEQLRLVSNLIERSPDGIWLKDLDGRYQIVNPAGARLIGHPAAGILGKTDLEIRPAELAALIRKHDAEALRAGAPQAFEYHLVVEGAVRTFRITRSLYVAESGDIVGVIGNAHDITDHLRAEEVSRHLASIVESSQDAITSTDLDGVITSWNKAAEQLYGYSAREAVGQNVALLVPPDRQDELQGILRRIAQGKSINQFETVRLRKDGKQVMVSLTISPARDASGKITGLSAIVRDVTERRRLEEQLRQSQKMESIGRLAGGIAHDFNNLLTIIAGYGDIVQRALEAESPLRAAMGQICRAADRATSLTRQLLAFSRKQILQPQSINLNVIVADLQKSLDRLIGEDIALHARLDPELALVRADPGQIEQVIMNLVVNARDAMPRGGELTIETKGLELDAEYAQHCLDVEPGSYVMLAVSDSGCGMSREVMAQIFEPFFTTKEVGRGTGLGLAMVDGIIKQSGGHIRVYSEPGSGTTFKIYLPTVKQEPAAAEKRESGILPAPRGKETILLVEDEDGVRTLAQHSLETYGYKVIPAGDGGQALEIARQRECPFQLIITDVVMPRMSGRELVEQLRGCCPSVKVLFMSGYTDEAVLNHGILEEGAHFLQKPFTPSVLVRKVRETLDLS